MAEIKFEQKGALSRLEAADQLMAFATALREGGYVELAVGSGTLSLHIPDNLSREVEIEINQGEIELEIELKWPIALTRTAASPAREGTKGTARGRKSVPAKPERTSAVTGKGTSRKRLAAKTR
ncbi:amphi-Trp domain-containing protein [Streptomyces wuyuanensis]|uniref:amphi-Trp domain-containing protein n=1 Tax=Streptomyces wuyuanensis TaxID=1196353 RepID=UPI00343D29BE